MKKLIFGFLLLTLSACSAAPTAAPVAPQPIIVNVTVVAPVAPAVAEAPTVAAAAPATEVPTNAPAEPTATSAPVIEATPTSPPAVGADVFGNFNRSGDSFSLKCSPSAVTFSVTSLNAYIVKTQFYYRMIDKLNSIPSQWYAAGDMDSDKKGNFSIEITALEVNPDVRFDHGWFEYQFVGLNKTGDVVGRTSKELFAKQVTFTKDCP